MSKGSFVFAATCFACFFVTGCGEKLPSDVPKLYPASVKITLDGVPLPKATVTLTPDQSAGFNRPVLGVTEDNGVAALKTDGRYNGAPAGKYKVCVNKNATIEGPTSQKPAPTDPTELARYNRQVENERKIMPGIAEEYSNSSKTTLELEITTGKNSFEFEVKKAPGTPDFVD